MVLTTDVVSHNGTEVLSGQGQQLRTITLNYEVS